jgi:hypothetical protein
MSQCDGTLALQAIGHQLDVACSFSGAQHAELFVRLIKREISRVAVFELDRRRRRRRALEDAFDLKISCVAVRNNSPPNNVRQTYSLRERYWKM